MNTSVIHPSLYSSLPYSFWLSPLILRHLSFVLLLLKQLALPSLNSLTLLPSSLLSRCSITVSPKPQSHHLLCCYSLLYH